LALDSSNPRAADVGDCSELAQLERPTFTEAVRIVVEAFDYGQALIVIEAACPRNRVVFVVDDGEQRALTLNEGLDRLVPRSPRLAGIEHEQGVAQATAVAETLVVMVELSDRGLEQAAELLAPARPRDSTTRRCRINLGCLMSATHHLRLVASSGLDLTVGNREAHFPGQRRLLKPGPGDLLWPGLDESVRVIVEPLEDQEAFGLKKGGRAFAC
jgi:hypothetical protein